jgi:hypothetical protein
MAECLRLGKVDIANREVIPCGQLRRQLARQLSDDPFPLPLRRLILAYPKASGQGDLDLIFAWAPFGFVGRTTHGESAWWAPAKFDADNLSLVPYFRAVES